MTELLDTLVKLASLGASGISIFAIFWIGWLLLRLPSDAGPERHRTLRLYMLVCFGIALISGGAGLANAYFNADTISELNRQVDKYTEKIARHEELQATARGTVNALEAIVKSKELAAAASGSDEIQRQVQTLTNVIHQLTNSLAPM